MANLFVVGAFSLYVRGWAVGVYLNKVAPVQSQRCQSPNKKDIRSEADIFPT